MPTPTGSSRGSSSATAGGGPTEVDLDAPSTTDFERTVPCHEMRIATWNVNSLKARMEAVELWLDRVRPDVVLVQETKLSDVDAPVMPFGMLGYELIHHGEGRWNGVAILSRVGAEDVVTNFGDGPVRDSSAGADVAVSEDDFNPFDEARMVSAVCGGVRGGSLYAPHGRGVGSPFYEGKLRWFR